MRYGYNSPSTPTSTYDYDLATRERTLRKVQEVALADSQRVGFDRTDTKLYEVASLTAFLLVNESNATVRTDGCALVDPSAAAACSSVAVGTSEGRAAKFVFSGRMTM
jgi:hypothetical protein